VKVGLISYYRNSIAKTILFWLALFLYLLSLLSISIISPQSGDELRGYEILLYGGIQTFLGLVSFNLLSALPWLGNIVMLLTFIFIYSNQSKKVSIYLALFGLVCTLSFLYSPYVMLGPDLRLIEVDVNTGTYLWFFSSLILLCTSLFIQEMPNKPFKQDK
jgi:hypothetical protein